MLMRSRCVQIKKKKSHTGGCPDAFRFFFKNLKCYFFILEVGLNVRAHLLVPLHFLGSTAFEEMR